MKTRPKFAVGEECLVTRRDGGFERVVITEMEYCVEKSITNKLHSNKSTYSGWVYYLDIVDDDYFTQEKFLRKLPPEDRLTWNDCEWQPTREGVEA